MAGSPSEPANPSPQYEACPSCHEPIPWAPGFSKREQMAIDILAALLKNVPPNAELNGKDIAGDAVALTDALLDTLDVM